MRQLNFVVSRPKFTESFSRNAGGNVVDSPLLVDISIRSGDIRDRSPKLSEITCTVHFCSVGMRQLNFL